MLNTLAEGPSSHAQLATALKPFLEDNPQSLQETVLNLQSRGWVRLADGNLLILTSSGEAAHTRLQETVANTRRQLVQGVSEEEYSKTIDVLRRMANNLEEIQD